jgi:hypothetical protein
MTNLITLERAKVEIKRLQHYVDLVENYEDDTIDKFIIKTYAITNSINKTIELANASGFYINHQELTRAYMVSVIKRTGKDELHKLIRTGYMKRTKHIRF